MTGILPIERVRATLGDLAVGEFTWTVPWAMTIDAHRCCWLNTTFSSHAVPGGTVDMLVSRTAEGWTVDISKSVGNWTPEASPKGEPVTEVIAAVLEEAAAQ